MEAWSQPAPDLTFASLLDVEEIRLGEPELVSGGDQVGRVVRWVHIADSENVAQFLEGGELVLSTGMSYRSSLESTATFFDQLESASAGGAVTPAAAHSARQRAMRSCSCAATDRGAGGREPLS